MKVANLFHNPKAGDSLYNKSRVTSLLKAEGYKCVYISTNEKKWNMDDAANLCVIAGGDGTVRKVVSHLLHKAGAIPPLALLPLGTANNIAGTMNITGSIDKIIASWRRKKYRAFDVGSIYGLDETDFFLESTGCGIFANLMNIAKKREMKEKNSDEKLAYALQAMRRIATEYKERNCLLEIDGVDHSGRYLMAEIMNINSIGPNLYLNPMADTGDGKFEIVLVKETHRQQLLDYLDKKIQGFDVVAAFETLQGSHIKIQWEGLHVHVDDKIIKVKEQIKADIRAGVNKLHFITSGVNDAS